MSVRTAEPVRKPGFLANLNVSCNTVVLNVMFICSTMLVSVLIAIAISGINNRYCKKTVQSIVILPHFIFWTVIALLCESLRKTSNGFVNNLIVAAGGTKKPRPVHLGHHPAGSSHHRHAADDHERGQDLQRRLRHDLQPHCGLQPRHPGRGGHSRGPGLGAVRLHPEPPAHGQAGIPEHRPEGGGLLHQPGTGGLGAPLRLPPARGRSAEGRLRALDESASDRSNGFPAILNKCTGSYHGTGHNHHIAMNYADFYFIEAILKLRGDAFLFWQAEVTRP